MFKNRKKILAGLAVGGTFLFGGVALAPITFAANTSVNVQVNVQKESVADWNKGAASDITAVGLAPADSRGVAIAREAAIMSAQRSLIGIVKGLSIDSETTMRDLIIESDVVNRKITGILRGATIVEEQALEDGGYYVKMRVPIYGSDGLAAAVIPEIQQSGIPEPFLTASEPVVEGSSLPHYTGVVIDSAGLGMESTFSPVIYDTNGRAIYGIKNLKPDLVIEKGMVSYSEKVDSSITKDRAGDNPLVVKAVEVRGGNNSSNKVNAVVSVEDADKILLANEQTQILEKCAVVFVK